MSFVQRPTSNDRDGSLSHEIRLDLAANRINRGARNELVGPRRDGCALGRQPRLATTIHISLHFVGEGS